MIKICVDARLYSATGIGTFLKTLLPPLISQKHLQFTLLHRAEDKEQLDSFCCQLIEMKSPIYSIKEQFELSLKIPRCDYFWSPHFNVPIFPIKAKKRLTTIHDVYHLAHLSSLNTLEKCYVKLLYNAAFVLSDTITTPSHFTRMEIQKYASLLPKKIVVIPNGMEGTPCQEKLVREEFLLCVSNFKSHKNILKLIEAYRYLKPKERLVLVGRMPLHGKFLIETIRGDPFLREQVTLTDYVSKGSLSSLYQTAKLFIFPSLYEGFGFPPLEAMQYGCPVVAAERASIPEVCRDAVEYVDPGSMESIAGGIQSLLTNERRREELVKKGSELVKEYSIQKAVQSICSLWT